MYEDLKRETLRLLRNCDVRNHMMIFYGFYILQRIN